jgi:signal transduction histidine kinase/ligand-binding sensor domain-containing protein
MYHNLFKLLHFSGPAALFPKRVRPEQGGNSILDLHLTAVKKIVLLLAGLFFLLTAAKTQPYYFRHYQVENGLSHNTVFCTTQDNKGFLWFGTKDGLNRFDGYRFKTFNIRAAEKGSLERDLILSLATDPKGTIWVGTQRGLFYFDAERERFVSFLDTLHGINDIFFDHQGQLWFIADYTVTHYNFATQKITSFPPEWFFSATSLCQTPDGTMWFSTLDGYLQQFNAATQSFKSYFVFGHSPTAESNVIQKIASDKKGTILVGTNNQGIKEFWPDKHDYRDVLTLNPDRTSIFVRDILLVNDQETWFATESGIFIRDNGSGKIIQLKKKTLDPYSISDNAIYTLFKDSEGGIWAGTFFGGLNYFAKQLATFQKYFPDYAKNSISGNAVREICEDKAGNLWIGTEDAGLNKLNPQTGEIVHFAPTGKPGSISYYNIHGLLVVDDELWIGTFEHGLNIMDIKTGRVKKHYLTGANAHGLQNNFIVSMLKTRTGDIYLGTVWGVFQYDRKDHFRLLTEIAEGSFISCLLEDSEGTIWIATHNRGLFYFNPHTGVKGHFRNEPGNENSLTNNSINSLYEDSNGNLWLATEGGGLCRLEKKNRQFTAYSTRNGLPSNFVFKVLEDRQKTFWITTSKGLVNLDMAQGKLTVYTKADGLLNDQFNYNSGYKDAQGNMYFGSVQGMIRFNPDAFLRKKYTHTVYITGLQVQNKEIERSQDSSILKKAILSTSQIVLPYDQSSFSIDFAAPSFLSPETTEYSYIMKGLDKDWTYLKTNRKVYFTNLKPGKYTFKVKAGSNGQWDTKETALTIVITPPFWATAWAFLVYFVAVSLLVVYLVRSYHRMQEDKKEREIYQAKIEFFTNIAHEIKTPLTLIKGPVENLGELVDQAPDIKEDVHTLERNTNRLLNLINQILDFRQTETRGFSLDFSEINMNELLQEAYETFRQPAKKKNLRYKLDLPAAPVFLMADAEALTKIFHNLFSNAVKYAESEVTARMLQPARGETRLVIEISNDGHPIPEDMKEKIFEPFFRLKDVNKQKGTGLGLALARSLVELHNGKIYVKESDTDTNIFMVELPYSYFAAKRKNTNETSNQIA